MLGINDTTMICCLCSQWKKMLKLRKRLMKTRMHYFPLQFANPLNSACSLLGSLWSWIKDIVPGSSPTSKIQQLTDDGLSNNLKSFHHVTRLNNLECCHIFSRENPTGEIQCLLISFIVDEGIQIKLKQFSRRHITGQ